MMQPDIFDRRGRMSDPATSHAAGRRVAEFSHAHAERPGRATAPPDDVP